MRTVRRAIPVLASLLLSLPAALSAQASKPDTTRAAPDSARKIAKLAPIAVTATLSPKSVFHTATPLLVTDAQTVKEELPNGIQDLFRNLPGVDVVGVGPNQGRLQIRGQRGQRILLMEDGMRLNNSRRQQDFGELPALTDVNGLSRVEIVRGPASVLYGTDAIGGVVNQILRPLPSSAAGVNGWTEYRYGSSDAQSLVNARLEARQGRLAWAFSGGYRDASDYSAPSGSFGDVQLSETAPVNDTGVRDWNLNGEMGWDLGSGKRVTARVNHYEADNAGFGYVDSELLGDPTGSLVRITYPTQNVTRARLGYEANGLSWGMADRFSVAAWGNWNQRTLDFSIQVPGFELYSHNFTDIASYGLRMEAAKILGGRHTVTYGFDAVTDVSDNTDSSLTTIPIPNRPPMQFANTTPQVPNAQYSSGGLFGQAELALASRFTLGLGIRAQYIGSKTRTTPGLDTLTLSSTSDAAVVGSVSGTFALTRSLNVIGVVGRAFRAPNLVEKYFQGATPEGGGYQVPNPDLKPEQSLNFDVGFKYRRERAAVEAFYFSNTISDAIRIAPTGTNVGRFPAYQNVNVDKLRDYGVEALAEVALGAGFSVLGHYTWLQSKNLSQEIPVGDSYSTKVGGELGWRSIDGRFALAGQVRHQGERKDINLGEASPVGPVLPPFTTYDARAAVRLPVVAGTVTTLTVQGLNLSNVLYSEAANTSFFRPEPGRRVVMSVRVDF